MRIRVLGAGFYGCHIAASLLRDGHDVEVHEIADHIFAGASGAIPARIHRGFHYPRSLSTRLACNQHYSEFMAEYGDLTRSVPVNIYAIAAHRSMVDFGTYRQVLDGLVQYVEIERPDEFGLQNVEGAVLTGERHIVTDLARRHFESVLSGHVRCGVSPTDSAPGEWDWTIDATFCAHDAVNIDRFEPCLVVLLRGPTDKAVTIMDGPFPSLYPWNESRGLCSLSSAQWTPFSKTCRTYAEARQLLDNLTGDQLNAQVNGMIDSMREFYPGIADYAPVDYLTSIRAMPLSGSDARLVDVVRTADKTLRIRAGKIDAVIQAEHEIRSILDGHDS